MTAAPIAVAAIAALAVAACDGAGADGDQVLGGARVEAAVLARGAQVYLRHCAPCHGEAGDGRGPAARGMWPPPRDFTAALFKYAGVAERGLPADDELRRIVRHGLPGSAMRAWELPAPDLDAVIHHLKTFSPAGTGFRDPTRVVTAPAPPSAEVMREVGPAAVAAGERLYHVELQCGACHPSYAAPAALAAWQIVARPDAGEALPKWSSELGTIVVPTDFGREPMRSVRDRDPGPALDHDPIDLNRVIAHGLSGPMPGYGHLGERDVWRVALYVKSLADAGAR